MHYTLLLVTCLVILNEIPSRLAYRTSSLDDDDNEDNDNNDEDNDNNDEDNDNNDEDNDNNDDDDKFELDFNDNDDETGKRSQKNLKKKQKKVKKKKWPLKLQDTKKAQKAKPGHLPKLYIEKLRKTLIGEFNAKFGDVNATHAQIIRMKRKLRDYKKESLKLRKQVEQLEMLKSSVTGEIQKNDEETEEEGKR